MAVDGTSRNTVLRNEICQKIKSIYLQTNCMKLIISTYFHKFPQNYVNGSLVHVIFNSFPMPTNGFEPIHKHF